MLTALVSAARYGRLHLLPRMRRFLWGARCRSCLVCFCLALISGGPKLGAMPQQGSIGSRGRLDP